jgi:hypothetical protein
MGEILDTTISFFQEDGWLFRQLEGQSVLAMGFQGESGQWTCYAQAREEQRQFVFYSVCPVNAPEDKRLAVAEFLTRANYGLFIGNFELDFDDGEIRYKTSIDVEGDRLTPALVQQLVYTNVLMMDQYLSGLMSVIYGDVAPAEAVAKAEGTARRAEG